MPQKRDHTLERIIEIILYQLTSGTGEKFHKTMTEMSVPLHQSVGLDVLAYGHSLNSADTYFLIRAFDNLEQMTASLDALYNSDEWLNGPRSDILGAIQSSVKSVLPLSEAAIYALKSSWDSGENASL